jgi:hypothetical protein
LEECTSARGVRRALDQCKQVFGGSMRTFVAETTRIDVVAQISQEGLEIDRLVLSRFEGSRTIAHEAFGKIGRSRRSKPPAEYTIASQLINEAD